MSYDVCVWFEEEHLDRLCADQKFNYLYENQFEQQATAKTRIYQFILAITKVFPENDEDDSEESPRSWAADFDVTEGAVFIACTYSMLDKTLPLIKTSAQKSGLFYFDPQTGEFENNLIFSQDLIDISEMNSYFSKRKEWQNWMNSKEAKRILDPEFEKDKDFLAQNLLHIEELRPLADAGSGGAQKAIGFTYFLCSAHTQDKSEKVRYYNLAQEYLLKSVDKVSGQKSLLRELKARAKKEGITLGELF